MNYAPLFFDFCSLDPVLPNEILVLLLLLGVLIFVWDLLDRRSSSLRKSGGISAGSEVVAMRDSAYLEPKEFRSEKLGLSSKPHGLVKENGLIIPIDVAPLTKKIKDRHVIQMMVHLRLIEETEGHKPPYGILVLGPEARSVKLKNTPEKQEWLDSVLAEMQSICDGAPTRPDPAFYKCKSCDVATLCKFSACRQEAGSEKKE